MNKKCHNFRISHDIDMKLGPVAKLDNINTATSKNFHDDVMIANYDVILLSSIYGHFAAIPKPDSKRMV